MCFVHKYNIQTPDVMTIAQRDMHGLAKPPLTVTTKNVRLKMKNGKW